jgi:hypothetical protein
LADTSGAAGLSPGALGDEGSWQAARPTAARVRNANGLI